MTAEEKFLNELNIFRNEVESALKSLYAELAIHQIASEDKKVLKALNLSPTFWNTVLNGLQHSTFIILGRILDNDGKHTIRTLLKVTIANKNIFTEESFKNRFLKDSSDTVRTLEWYEEYGKKSYFPTDQDFEKLNQFVETQREIYKTKYRPIRDHFGHKLYSKNEDVKVLFGVVIVRDLEKFCVKLKGVHEALWQLYHNARGPLLPIKQGRYSTKSILKKGYKKYESRPINAHVIEEAKKALNLLKRGNN